MSHQWLSHLKTAKPVEPASSASRRMRATAILGDGAVAWAVAAGKRMADHILSTLPDWPGENTEEEYEALRRATEASTLDTLLALQSGDWNLLSESVEPIENVIFYIRNGITLDEVLRNVHSGEEFLIEALVEEIERLDDGPAGMIAVKQMVREVSTSWSLFARHISVTYQAEHARWSSSQDEALERIVKRILDHGRIDVVLDSESLDYDITQAHVALTLSLPDAEIELARVFDFASVASTIAAAAKATGPLMIRRGPTYVDVWIGSPKLPLTEALEHASPWPSDLRIATGELMPGLEGFRLSHLQARAAHRVSRLMKSTSTVTHYADVALASLLVADLDRARAYVQATIGPLCDTSARSSELRKTLRAFIDNKGSIAQTARTLFTHRNTITYRLNQIDELLGPDLDNTRIRCALELTELLPHHVLSDSPAQ